MLKQKINRCVFVRVCVLLSILCLAAHVYVEFMEYDPKSRTVTPMKQDPKLPETSNAGPTLYCPTGHQSRKWKIELEPFASDDRNLEDEALRFIQYITTLQVSCENPSPPLLEQDGVNAQGPWTLCLDSRFNLARSIDAKRCRVYSLGLGSEDKSLEKRLAQAGCEVHCFDPSIREPHLQDSHMWVHRLSVDWRDPNPAMAQRKLGGTKKLSAILNHFGHRQMDVLKMDMESAEWKIIENLILEGVLYSVGVLLLEVHLHWAGFEVSGDEPSVVRYWFSLLRELESAHFRLYHSYVDPAKPRQFLQRSLHNASSTYILGWINTCYSPY